MKIRLLCALLLTALPVAAADRISRTLVITNAPIGNTNSVTWNGSARTITNTVTSSPATLIQETNTVSWTATNILNHFTLFKATPGNLITGGTNFVRITGGVGENPTLSINACCWGFVTNSTQTVSSPTFAVRVPITVEASSNQVSIASLLAKGISDSSTNALATNSTAGSNFAIKGASPLQTIESPFQFFGRTAVNSNFFATNGFTKSLTNIDSWNSNLVNQGSAIRSEGTGGNSFQAGSNALAQGSLAVALGNSSLAHGANSVAIGTSSIATNSDTVSIGTGAITTNSAAIAIGSSALVTGGGGTAIGFDTSAAQNAVAVGNEAAATATSSAAIVGTASGIASVAIGAASTSGENSVAIGYLAAATHSNSVALGKSSATTSTNQIRLGSAAESVSIPGILEVSGTQTDTIFSGTNKFQLAISYSVTNITSLANGGNDLDPGLKTYLKVSGPTAAYSIDKIDRGYDGRILIIQKTDSLTMTVLNNSGFGVLGDSAKILTGTGGTLTITNNPGFVELIYDASASRWGVRSKSN